MARTGPLSLSLEYLLVRSIISYVKPYLIGIFFFIWCPNDLNSSVHYGDIVNRLNQNVGEAMKTAMIHEGLLQQNNYNNH